MYSRDATSRLRYLVLRWSYHAICLDDIHISQGRRHIPGVAMYGLYFWLISHPEDDVV